MSYVMYAHYNAILNSEPVSKYSVLTPEYLWPIITDSKTSIFSNGTLHCQWCINTLGHYSFLNVIIMWSVNIKRKFDSTKAAGNGQPQYAEIELFPLEAPCLIYIVKSSSYLGFFLSKILAL